MIYWCLWSNQLSKKFIREIHFAGFVEMYSGTATCFALSVELEELTLIKIYPRVSKSLLNSITEGDSLSTLICERLMSKTGEFKQRSQIMQMLPKKRCSVKRCVELSPSCKPPSERSTRQLWHATTKSSSRQPNYAESPAQGYISAR